MSCNGCRVLRKGCSDTCNLRPCLQWIDSPEAQGHATVFVAKFFGRAGLMGFISAVPEQQRSALFQSLLYEACGRTVNPVFGAVGLLWSGNWELCQAAVDTVLNGGSLRPPSPSSVLLPVSLGSPTALALSGKFTDRVADPTQLTFLSNTSTAASSFSLGVGLEPTPPTAQEPPTEFRASHNNNDWTLEPNSESRNQLHYPTTPRETPLPRRVRARVDSNVAPQDSECDHLELDLTLKVKSERKTSAGVKRRSSPCHSVNSEGSVTSLDSSAARQQPSSWPLEMSLTPQPYRQLLPLMQ